MLTMYVRPRRRTSTDPSLAFSDFSELRTFITVSFEQPAQRLSTRWHSARGKPAGVGDLARHTQVA